MNTIAASLLIAIAIFSAHGAGGGYVIATKENRSAGFALVRTVASVALAGIAILILSRH